MRKDYLRLGCTLVAAVAMLCGCGGRSLAGTWKTDQMVPGLTLELSADGTYVGTLFRSGPANTPIAGNYTVEGDMLKLTMADVDSNAGAGRQLIGTLATDYRTFTLQGFGVVRRQ